LPVGTHNLEQAHDYNCGASTPKSLNHHKTIMIYDISAVYNAVYKDKIYLKVLPDIIWIAADCEDGLSLKIKNTPEYSMCETFQLTI